MRTMGCERRRSVLALALSMGVVAAGAPAGASVIATEAFQPSFPAYASGGTGFSGRWEVGGFNALAAGYYAGVESLVYPGLRSCRPGNVSGPAFPAINGMVRDLSQPLGAAPVTFYVGFLLRPEGVLNEGVFSGFFGLTLNGNLGNDLFVGKPGGGALGEYVVETRGGGGQVSSGERVLVGKVALMVLKVELRPGLDVFTLYANPNPHAGEPQSGAVKTDLDLGTVSRIGVYSTGAFAIDELRIGTTYEDVLIASGRAGGVSFPGCLAP